MVEPTQLPRYTRDDFRLVVESSPPPPPPAPAGTQAQAGGTNADTLLEGLTWSAAQPGVLPAAEAVFLAPNRTVFLAPDQTAPVAPDQTVPVAPDRTAPVVGLNQLVNMPDADLDDAPVVLPRIRVSEPVPTESSALETSPAAPQRSTGPRLSDSFQFHPKPTVTARSSALLDAARVQPAAAPVKKRHPLRKLFGTLVVLGLLGFGGWEAKKKFLDKLDWQSEVKPMADHVAKARGLAFSDAVKVVDVPAASYATTLATSVLGITDANKVSLTAEWRSLGLLSGPLDLAAIGAAAVPDAPAFYDPASKSVMVRAGLVEPARTFAVQRGLAAALLDQHFHWSTVAAGHSAGAAGSRALFDGDALHTAWNAMTPADVDGVQPLLDALRPDAGSPSPWASAMIGRPGLSLAHLDRSGAGDALAQAESAKIVSDRGIYDLMQDVAVALPLAVKDPTATRGMMYWYYVLAARVDSTTAWNAALHWTGDSVTTTSDGGAGCVTATVFGGDAGGADALQQAFAAWAAASPADMHAHSAVDGNKVNLGACDLGETVSAVVATPVSLGGAVLEADAVNAATRLAEVAPTAAQVACLTGVARMKSAGFTSPADDVPLLIPSAGWKSPYLAAATPTPSEVSDCTK